MTSHPSLFSTELGIKSAFMAWFIVEKCFRDVFTTFLVYFVSTIETFGWVCLIYQSTSFYILGLVEEFYDSFAKIFISDDHKSFQLK